MNAEKVMSYINNINEKSKKEKQMENLNNSVENKERVREREYNKAIAQCLDLIFAKLYKKSLPLNDNYKVARDNELSADIHDCIAKTAPQGTDFYVKEAIKKGNPVMKQMMESVKKAMNNRFYVKYSNLNETTLDELMFTMDAETEDRVDDIMKDMNFDELSEIIHNNVKMTIDVEIEKSKLEKDALEKLEDELSQDISITTEAAIEHAMMSRNLMEKSMYQPSLFEGILVGKFNKCVTESADDQDDAFNEAVREFTMLNVKKALKLESYSTRELAELAFNYARK